MDLCAFIPLTSPPMLQLYVVSFPAEDLNSWPSEANPEHKPCSPSYLWEDLSIQQNRNQASLRAAGNNGPTDPVQNWFLVHPLSFEAFCG